MSTSRREDRDTHIYVRRAYGESLKLIASDYGISASRVTSIIRAETRRRKWNRAGCINCGHSGAMHHNEKWEYNRGPCAEHLCECQAMEASHD